MSAEDGRGCAAARRRGAKWIWATFPHVVLILSLIGYAVFGAFLFQAIEGGTNKTVSTTDFANQIVNVVRGFYNKTDQPDAVVVKKVVKILNEYNSTLSQMEKEWTFFQSLFFCCTVFTTVGYGHLYPLTDVGKVACVLYAMLGIPLMLLVISDVGDILAVLFSSAYQYLHSRYRALLKLLLSSRRWSPRRGHPRQPGDGTYTPTAAAPLDIRLVLRSQSSVKSKANRLLNNMEIFDRIVAREKFECHSRNLVRACSCPQLNQMPPPPTGFQMWDLSSVGQEMERFDVPIMVIMLVVFAYVLCWALILPCWETNLSRLDAFYFCFITLTTIGFGDIVPEHPNYFMLTFLFIITGMAIMSMAFKLGLTRTVCFYRRCIACLNCLGLGRAGTYQVKGQQSGEGSQKGSRSEEGKTNDQRYLFALAKSSQTRQKWAMGCTEREVPKVHDDTTM